MESRDVKRERMLTVLEQAIVAWIVLMPVKTAVAAFGSMILMGALHSANQAVPAIGWWTAVGISFGLSVLLLMVEGTVSSIAKKVDHVRNS